MTPRETAGARVAESDTLRPWRRIIFQDWPEGNERWQWVATAPEEDIIEWAEMINEAAGDEVLLTTTELAEAWGVSPRRAQAHVAWLHERSAGEVGRRIGRQWALTIDEAARCRPGKAGRRPRALAVSEPTVRPSTSELRQWARRWNAAAKAAYADLVASYTADQRALVTRMNHAKHQERLAKARAQSPDGTGLSGRPARTPVQWPEPPED